MVTLHSYDFRLLYSLNQNTAATSSDNCRRIGNYLVKCSIMLARFTMCPADTTVYMNAYFHAISCDVLVRENRVPYVLSRANLSYFHSHSLLSSYKHGMVGRPAFLSIYQQTVKKLLVLITKLDAMLTTYDNSECVYF